MRRRLCKNIGKECLLLQLQDLSTRSGLSEEEPHDEPPQPQQQPRDAGPDSPSTSWDGFHALLHHPGGKIMDSQCQYTSDSGQNGCCSSPKTPHGTFIGINRARLAQPLPCAAFCDDSSLTRTACSGRAEQPCPPISVLMTHGSGAA